jgi:hypothetical protein
MTCELSHIRRLLEPGIDCQLNSTYIVMLKVSNSKPLLDNNGHNLLLVQVF